MGPAVRLRRGTCRRHEQLWRPWRRCVGYDGAGRKYRFFGTGDDKRRTVERRVFPGYLLVQMILTEESWYVVRNTPGVTGFVGMGETPTPLRPEEVTKIMNRMEAEAPKVKFDFQVGEKVRIGTGP